MKRRIISIITALALCLGLCPSVALAADREYGSLGQRQATRAPQYNGVVVSGEIFTDATDITTKSIGSGTVTWDPNTAELTLENVNCVDSNASVLLVTADPTQTVTLILKGKNILNATANNGSRVVLEIHCNLKIKMEDGASLDILAGENQNAIFSTSLNLTIEGNGPVTLHSGRYPAIYGTTTVDIQGGNITATSTSSNAIYSDGSIQITNSELNATGYYPAIWGRTGVNIQGGTVTANSTVDTAIFSPGSIQITNGANVTARGNGCAIYTPGTLNISGSTVTGHSEANHVIYTTAPMTIENSELTLTSEEYFSGLFLAANSPLTISGCTNVNVTTGGSAIVSNGDVSITNSSLKINSGGNGIVAAVEADNGGGTLSISGATHIDSQSEYPLTGYKVEMTGGYVKSVTSDGPAISATNGITVSGGEVYAESTGTFRQQGSGLYSRKGEINLTGEDTKVQAISANYRAIYNEEGTIRLNTNVIAKAGPYDPAFMACSVTNDTSADPTHNITIGEGFSSQGNRPVTTKWKNETLITGYSHFAYTVLAPAGTDNLKDDYLDTPNQITIAACSHPDNQCAYAHIAGTATHVRTCLDCGKVWDAEPCTYTFSGTTGACAACGDSVTVAVSGTEGLVYDGTAKTPGVTVTRGTTELTADAYSVAYANNTNAGNATVTVTIGSNQGTYTGNFTIGRATPMITWGSANQGLTYTGNPAAITAPTVTLVGSDTFSGTLTYSHAVQGSTEYKEGLPTNAGTYAVKAHVDAAGNYAAADSGEMTLTINKSLPTIVFAGSYNPSKTYDGQTIPNPTEANLTITGANFSDVTFTWTAAPKDAGTYTLTAKIGETNNTEAASAALDVTISPKTVANPTITLSPDTFVYDGTEKKPAVTLKDGETEIPASEYTVTYSDNVNVGTAATVTITDNDGGNYTVSGTATFAITKAAQAPLTITGAPGTVTYGDTFQLGVSGGSGAGAVSWTAAGATVDGAGNVTVTSAGQVEITATKAGDSNYSGTEGRITLTAGKKALTVTGASAESRRYNGANAVKITGVTLSGIVGGDTVSVSTEGLNGTLNGSNAGSYTSVTLPAMTLTGEKAGNYTLTRPAGAVSASVTISKAAALTPKTGALEVTNKQAHTYTYGLGALRPDLPAGMSFGSSAVTYTLGAVSLGSYYTGGAVIEGQTLTLPIEAVESNEAEKIGAITVTIKSGNFEDMTTTINVRSVNKTIPTGAPTLSAATLTYGQPLSTITLSGSMKDGSADVPGAFTWSSPDNRPAAQEAYAAAWVFKPDDNNTYAVVNGTAIIQVLPAPIAGAEIVLDPAAFRYDGAAHRPSVSSVTLNGITLTADVDYTAEIPEGTEAGSYTVTVTGKGNYTGTAAATFTINPVEQKPLDQTDDDGHELRLEVETGLSSVPAALENDARYDTPEKIETALRTQVEQVMSNVGESIAVFDVTLQYKDESGTWRTVDPDDFPAEGVTAILPYPDGTGAAGYTFTVQHLISSGAQAGTMETLSYTLTADGLQCKFSSLSPVAIGYQAAEDPGTGHDPTPILPSGGFYWDGGSAPSPAPKPDKEPDTEPAPETETPCDGGADCPSRSFTDLGSVGTWYHEAVDYVLRNNLMGGYGNGTFGPNDTLTRAQFAQLLFNKEGRPVVNYLLQFTDISSEAWYAEAVRWAASQSIVGGYADGRFGPNDNITREQLAVMLWRYAGSPAAADKDLHFTDADKASGYALEALRWAVENGVMGGYGNGQLAPQGLATRAQVVQMLKNFLDGYSD